MMVKIRELLNLPGATRQMGNVGLKVPGGSCKGKCSQEPPRLVGLTLYEPWVALSEYLVDILGQ